jgi:hypothetical protein
MGRSMHLPQDTPGVGSYNPIPTNRLRPKTSGLLHSGPDRFKVDRPSSANHVGPGCYNVRNFQLGRAALKRPNIRFGRPPQTYTSQLFPEQRLEDSVTIAPHTFPPRTLSPRRPQNNAVVHEKTNRHRKGTSHTFAKSRRVCFPAVNPHNCKFTLPSHTQYCYMQGAYTKPTPGPADYRWKSKPTLRRCMLDGYGGGYGALRHTVR